MNIEVTQNYANERRSTLKIKLSIQNKQKKKQRLTLST